MNREEKENIELLRNSQVFSVLTEEELREVARLSRRLTFDRGDVIFKEGTRGADIFIIIEGKVAVKIESISPNVEIGVATLSSGEVFGEFSFIDGQERSATVEVLEPTIVLSIDGEGLRQLMEKDNRLGYLLMRSLSEAICRRIRRTNRKLINFIRVKLYG